MAKPSTVDQLTAGLRTQPFDYLKPSISSRTAGTFCDMFLLAGYPGAMTTPSSAGAQCNTSTIGAMQIGAVPGGKQAWLAALSGATSQIGSLSLMDRLVHWGGLSGIVTTAQLLGAVVLPRFTDGVGVLPYLVFYTATGATTTTATILYTNELGVSGRSTSVTIPASPAASQCIPIPLVPGDRGCLSVQSVTLTASTGTAGNFGIYLARRHAKLGGGGAGQNLDKDWLQLGLPEIADGACLGFLLLCSTTSTGQVDLILNISDV
jgi:hypothetical protein